MAGSNKLVPEKLQILKSHADEAKDIPSGANFSQKYATYKSYTNAYERILTGLKLRSSETEISNDGTIKKVEGAKPKKNGKKSDKSKKSEKKPAEKKAKAKPKAKAKASKPKKAKAEDEAKSTDEDIGNIPEEEGSESSEETVEEEA